MTGLIRPVDSDRIGILLLDSNAARRERVRDGLDRSGATVSAAVGAGAGSHDPDALDVVLVEPGVLRLHPATMAELLQRLPRVPVVVAHPPEEDGAAALMEAVLQGYVRRLMNLSQAAAALRRECRLIAAGHSAEGEAQVLDGIRAMVQGMEARDRLDRGGSRRVAAIAVALAEALGENELEGVRMAAEFHDIGRLGVDAGIWRKQGSLTEEEQREVRRHTCLGLQMLSPMIKEPRVLAAILWHHERWDGEGYPDGLRGEQIPRLARILGVADALAAMTTARPYRPRRSWAEALAEVRAGRGSQFAPDVVDALHRVEAGIRASLRSLDGTAPVAPDNAPAGDGAEPVRSPAG